MLPLNKFEVCLLHVDQRELQDQVREVERTRSVNCNARNIFIEASAEIFKCLLNRPSVS